jgi:hypothetical protein
MSCRRFDGRKFDAVLLHKSILYTYEPAVADVGTQPLQPLLGLALRFIAVVQLSRVVLGQLGLEVRESNISLRV